MRIPIIPEKSPSSKKQNIAKSLRGLGENIAGSAVKGSKKIMTFAKDAIKNLNSEEFKTTAMVALLSATAMILGSDEKPDTSSETAKKPTLSADRQVEDSYEEPATTQPYAESTSELRQQVGPAPSYSQQPRQIDEKPTPNKNYTSDEKVVKRLDKYREQKDGLAILDYSKETCQQFDIPISVFREMINVESSWKPSVKNRISSATGLGQFLDSSWRYFMAYCKSKNIHDPRWGDRPLTLNHRYNPYCSIYATAWAIHQTKENPTLGKIIKASPPHIQGKIYYLAHHEGVTGAKRYLKFLEIMQSEGHVSKTAVRAAYDANPNRYNRILHPSQIRRIKRSGIKSFLSIYFTLCTRISSKVYASNNPDSTQHVAKREVREVAGSIEKHPASDTLVLGDSYAQGLTWVLRKTFPDMKYFSRHSSSTRHFIASLKGIKNKLLPLTRRNELIAKIKGAKSIFLKLGGNEYSRGLPKFKEGVRELAKLIRDINPKVQIIIPEIGPSNPKSSRRTSLARQHTKKESINKWIRSGGDGLFKPLKWSASVQDKNDPRFMAKKYASNDKIHVNRVGFRAFATAFLEQSVVQDTRVAEYVGKYGVEGVG